MHVREGKGREANACEREDKGRDARFRGWREGALCERGGMMEGRGGVGGGQERLVVVTNNIETITWTSRTFGQTCGREDAF